VILAPTPLAGGYAAVLAAMVAVLSLPHGARAQDYPNRTITIVAPSAPGGLYSLFARLLGARLEARLGKSVVVENRPGAASIAGAVSVARAAPDGYTLMVATSTTLATNLALHKKLPYDPIADFAPVTLIARVPEVLVVNADLPIRSIADLVRHAKDKTGTLTYASAGPGTSQHLSGETLKRALGIEMTHVPYKGMQPAINDVAGGHVALMFAPVPIALGLIDGGKLRVIGISTAERLDALPAAPPLSEIGVPGFNEASWFMLVAPAKTPRDIIERLHAELTAFTSAPDVRQELSRQGTLPVASPPPDALKRFVQSEIAHWAELVRRAGLTPSE
jgi:tripartite-type tricarboxylate transporter receptor subunit TctC